MSWLGGSLSSLTGHLQNLTKEVLLESKDGKEGTAVELKASWEKIEELEALCAGQKLEINVLKKQNADLLQRLVDGGFADEVGGSAAAAAAAAEAASEAVWPLVEHCGDAFLGQHWKGTSEAPEPANEILDAWNTELEREVERVRSLRRADEGRNLAFQEYIANQEKVVDNSSGLLEISDLPIMNPELQNQMMLKKNDLEFLTGNVKHQEMNYQNKELESMEYLVDELKASVAKLQEEKRGLQASLEELDKEHQDAVDQLLDLRRAEQVEKDQLKSELEEMKKARPTQTTSEVEVQTSFLVLTDVGTQTESFMSLRDRLQVEIVLKHNQELYEKIRKIINFDLPHEKENSDPLQVMEKVVKLCNEWKWKKDTLERKVTELMRDYNDAKDTICVLEEECSSLRENIEQLAEQLVGITKNDKQSLPTIHENSEETEAMEQKMAALETQVQVLSKVKVDMEADSSKMNERCQELQSKLICLEAQLQKQESLEAEVSSLQESIEALKSELQEVHALKTGFQNEVESLQLKLKECESGREEVDKEERDGRGVHEVKGDLIMKTEDLEQMKYLQQSLKIAQDEQHVCKAEGETRKVEVGSSNKEEQVKDVTELSNNFQHTSIHQDTAEDLSVRQLHSDFGPEMADLDQKLEKQEIVLEKKCVHTFCGMTEAHQEECIRLKSDIEELERKCKEAEKWKEKAEIVEKDLQLVSKEKEALEVENNSLTVSNISFQRQNEILQGTVWKLENKHSIPNVQGTRIMEGSAHHESIESEDPDRISKSLIDDSTMKMCHERNQSAVELVEEIPKGANEFNCKIKHLSAIIEEHLATIYDLEQAKTKLTDQACENEKKLEMMKGTIAKLSDMMRDKEQECSEARELGRLELIAAQEAAAQAINERDQLVHTVQVKHQESLQYHAEIQRLTAVLTQEMQKYEETVMQYTTIVQKLEEQKNASEASEEVKQLQLLVAEHDKALQQCTQQLHVKELELKACHIEMEALRLRQQMDSEVLRGRPDGGMDQQEEDVHEKYLTVVSVLSEEENRNKKLQSQVDMHQAKEASLQREVDRLRLHLIEIEEMHTRETLHLEESIKDLQNKLLLAEEHAKSSSTLYKSASIRANQQVETLQEQARLIAQQRDELQDKLSVAEDQVAKHSAALRNLQAVLEQFQRDKEREVAVATAVVYSQVEAAQKRHHDLLAEIASLKSQLNEAKEGLGAAARLGEQLEKKATLISAMKKEVADLQEKLKKADSDAQSAMHVVEGKIDKSLAKNVVLGYFLAPSNSKEQVLHIVASVLDFSETERKQVQEKLGFHGPFTTSGGWFKNFLHSSGTRDGSNQSLSEAFVRFLENESIPHPRLRMLPDAEPKSGSSVNSNSISSTGTQRKSPLLLPDVQLPTFQHVGCNSSTILKDILKES